MSVKMQVLEVLESNRGTFISGNELAKKISVSRNAVWKAIKSLEEEGYQIQAIKNKGYSLSEETDILSFQSIRKHFKRYQDTFDIEVYKVIDSTNNKAKILGSEGALEGKVIIAEEQTGGKGRLGRSFFSPTGSGIYMSLLLRPKVEATKALLITTAAAVAVAEAIEAVSDKEAKIKWVNDIFIDDKKVCGILTEASLGMENGGVEYAVLGIGINVKEPKGGFPKEIKDIATSIFKDANTDVRSQLIAEILERFWDYYQVLCEKTYMEEYKRRSFLIGRRITVISGEERRDATALEINDDCQLKVRMDDGEECVLSTGEVSIKL